MKISKRALADIAVIEHFIPEWATAPDGSSLRAAVTDEDRHAFSAWSSTGAKIEVQTVGTGALKIGKTYRDAMVKTLRRDLESGVFWVHEFDGGFPPHVAAYLVKATGSRARLEAWRAANAACEGREPMEFTPRSRQLIAAHFCERMEG